MTSKLGPLASATIEEGTKTYEIEQVSGPKFRITVPASFKVTFGAIVPASAKAAATGHNGSGWGLRFWSATDKQHAVFSGVESFRDVSLPISVAAVRKFGAPDDEWFPDDGNYAEGTVEKAWKPLDQVKERPAPISNALPWEEDTPKTSKFGRTR